MKKCFLSLVAALCFLSFSIAQSKYTIIGTVPNSIDNVYVYLTLSDLSGNFTSKDSTLVRKGQFSFNGIVGIQKNVYEIWSVEYPAITGTVVIEPGTISYNYQEDDDKGYTCAKGTYLNDYLTDSIIIPMAQIARFGEMMLTGKVDIRNPESEKLMNEIRNYAQLLPKNILSLIRKNIDNPVSGYLFLAYNSFLRPPIINGNEMNDILALLPEDVRQAYEDKKNPTPQPSVGKQYIPFRGKMSNNTYLTLSDVIKQNKLTLLDFWATWCGPCIKELPVIVQLYNDYKDKGLEIISVSIDNNEQVWQSFIQKNNMSWLQVISKKGESDDIGKLYGVSSIPYMLLINSDGKVIATNIRGQELIDKIKNTLVQ